MSLQVDILNSERLSHLLKLISDSSGIQTQGCPRPVVLNPDTPPKSPHDEASSQINKISISGDGLRYFSFILFFFKFLNMGSSQVSKIENHWPIPSPSPIADWVTGSERGHYHFPKWKELEPELEWRVSNPCCPLEMTWSWPFFQTLLYHTDMAMPKSSYNSTCVPPGGLKW